MLRKRSRKRTGNQPETNSKLAVNFMNKLFLVRDIIGLNLLPSPPFPPLRFRFVPKNPLHLYPESPQKLHPNVQPIPSCHGLKAKNISPPKPKETTTPVGVSSQSGKSSCVSAAIPFLGGAARRAAGGMIIAPQRGPGAAPLARLW